MNTGNHSRRILIVDDEEHIRKVLSRALVTQGYEVATAAGGEEALALASSTPFDLALLDLKMPGMSGLEVLQRLKEMFPDLIVIMLTGVADNESLETQSRAQGAAAYLTKPCTLAELRECVGNAFRSAGARTISRSTVET